ncbi:hypothetical protein FACS189468_8030 [Spirochaetia bacterium]|nr:hypothetical protein FACS189468_8030 [Spirochaetia bacterium]
MGMITTVRGAIQAEELGFCQSHEHICILRGYSAFGGPDLCMDDPVKNWRELASYRQAGGAAVVDAQPLGCGRDAAMLKELSEQSGVHIIASTGFHKMNYYPEGHWMYTAGADTLTRLYLAELNRGMYLDGNTAFPENQGDSRAGQIKTALDKGGFTPHYEKLFAAAAAAALSAGVPLMVHIERDSDPLALADFLYNQGLLLSGLIFCHLDRAVAGHNYAAIETKGYRKLVVEGSDGKPKMIDNPRWG